MDSFTLSDSDVSDEDALTETHTGLLKALRQSLSNSSVGSLLASYRASLQKDLHDTLGEGVEDANDPPASPFERHVGGQLNPPALPSHSHASSLSFKGTNIGRTVANTANRGRARCGSFASSEASYDNGAPCSEYAAIEDNTPPLTPDLSFSSADAPSTRSRALKQASQRRPVFEDDDDVDVCYGPTREEVRKGKRPQRSTQFSIRYARSFSDDSGLSIMSSGSSTPFMSRNNSKEWFGMEYALETSKDDQQSLSVPDEYEGVGQYSKSRESWAALHQVYVDPAVDEQEYQQWKRWHVQLEWEEKRKRIQRTMDFLTHSAERSNLQVRECESQQLLSFQKKRKTSCYGYDRELAVASAEQQLALIVEFGSNTHLLQHFGSVIPLKRSCTMSCLRDFLKLDRL